MSKNNNRNTVEVEAAAAAAAAKSAAAAAAKLAIFEDEKEQNALAWESSESPKGWNEVESNSVKDLLAKMLLQPESFDRSHATKAKEALPVGIEKHPVKAKDNKACQYMACLGLSYTKLGGSNYYTVILDGQKINVCFEETARALLAGKLPTKEECIKLAKSAPSGWVNKSDFGF
jgi:hypothetical protein